MRIVGGTFRGRKLASPEGLATRPTSDRVREAVFNILNHASWRNGFDIEGAAVLDIFAGTGAMGLEALSQGAAHAVFIERDKKAIDSCRANIAACKVETQSRIISCDALVPIPRPQDVPPRTLVFLDPPYAMEMGAQALSSFAKKGWLADGAVVVMEMAKKSPETVPENFTLHDTRDYGVARVIFLTYAP